MCKWTIKLDKAFELPTYRVKADGLIVGKIRQFGTEWSWEATSPAREIPEWCRGTQLTRDGCRDAIRSAVDALTKGMHREGVRRRMVQGFIGRNGQHHKTMRKMSEQLSP